MTELKHIIWSDINFSDNFEEYRTEYPEWSEDQIWDQLNEDSSRWIDDERMNLDIQLGEPIIIIADLGLWDGRRSGYKMVDSGNIKDCLYSDCDYNEWYVDKNGDLRCTACHHDGTNHYLYRVIKPSATDEQIARMQNRIYDGQATRADITRVTERLGDKIGAVYGWSFPRTKQTKDQIR